MLRHVTVEPSGFTRTSTILEMERPATSPHHPDLGNGIDLLHFYSSLATASTCSDSLPWILRLPHKKREKHATPSDPPPKRSLLGGFGAMMNKMVGRSSKKVCRVKARGISFGVEIERGRVMNGWRWRWREQLVCQLFWVK